MSSRISDLISSGTAALVRILWQPSVEQEEKEDVDDCSFKARELCIPLRDECIRKEVAVSSRVPCQWDSLNVGLVIWDTRDDSLSEFGFLVSERNNVSAMTKTLRNIYQTRP